MSMSQPLIAESGCCPRVVHNGSCRTIDDYLELGRYGKDGRWDRAENPYIFRLISRLDPLERLPCDGLVLQLPARCLAAGRSEAENRRKIDLPAEARSVPSRPLMNVTISG